MNFIQENLTSVKQSENSKNDAIMSRNQVLGKPIMGPPANPTSKPSNTKTPSSARKKPTFGSAVLKSGSSRMVDNSQVIVALCEGRGQARGIVGIAAIDVNKPVLVLCQISDTQTYTNTLTKINILRPVEVLIPSSFVECTTPSRIITLLKDQFPNLTVSSVSRSAFRSSRGLSYVINLCAPQFISVNLVIRQKFYALASASALLKYIQKEQHVIYPTNSIKVEYQEPEDTAVIDIDSADRLELVSCCNQEERAINLLSMLDHSVTGVGRKMLRATILQPPCVDSVIQARLDCVQELRENAELRIKLKAILANLHNIECALLFGTMVPQSAAAVSDKQLNYTLQLKTLLTNIEPLRDILEVAHHPVFCSIHGHLLQAPYTRLLNKLHKVLNEEAHPASGHAGDLQRCFAIRTGLNGFLDIARRTYMEVIDDMRAYVQNLSDKYSLPLRIHHTQKRGFHIVLNLTGSLRNMEKSSLPPVFVKVERNTTHFTMTTSDMTSFGVRLQTNCQEIESISNVIIYQLMANIKQCIGHLYQLCDDVALLDVLQSLATVSTTSGYIRPKFSTEYMEVIGARHPLLEHSSTQEPVPNNIVASDLYNLHIVTGPNMSGKSIYVRQMPLLQVLAQIGCYVPARSAVFRSCTHVYARISVEDYLHDNSSATTSTFVREMTEIQYMLNTVGTGGRSLIILDELCHSTSVDEGVSIAIAICEQLLKTRAYIFVATHYLSMTKLANMYYNVNNSHLEAVEILRNTRKSLKFTHKLIAGVNGVETYGIKLSRICGGSDLVSDRAEQILQDILPTNKIILSSENPQNAAHLKFRLYADLKTLQLQNKLTAEAEQKLLDKYEQLTGKHYEVGQVLTEDKIPSRTSSSRGSGKTKSTTASSKQSTTQSKQTSKSSSSVYDVAKRKYTSDKSTSKSSDYLTKVVDSLIPSEEDFLHCITAEECADPLGVSVKQIDTLSDDSSDFEIIKTNDTSSIEYDPESPTYSPNFDMCTERFSPPFVPYTPDSLPAGMQLPAASPPSPTSNDDFEQKSLTSKTKFLSSLSPISNDDFEQKSLTSKTRFLTSLSPISNDDFEQKSLTSKTRFLTSLSPISNDDFEQKSTSRTRFLSSLSPQSTISTDSEPINLNRSEPNYSFSKLFDLNQPDSNLIDLKDSEPFELNRLNSKPIAINSLESPADSPSCEPKTRDRSSPETVSFEANIPRYGGTVRKLDHSDDITFEYKDETELRLPNVCQNELKQRESVTISTYYSVSNYCVKESGSLEHTVRQETRYTSYQESHLGSRGSKSSRSSSHHSKEQTDKHVYPSTSGYVSNVRLSREPSHTALHKDTNVFASTSRIQSPHRVSTMQDNFGVRFQEQNQFTNKSAATENQPFVFYPAPIKPFTFNFPTTKEPVSSTDKPIFGNTVPAETNIVPWFTSTAKPVKSFLPLWSDKEEKPTENTFKFNPPSAFEKKSENSLKTQKEKPKENIFNIILKPSASSRKSENFLETVASTSKNLKAQKEKPKETFKFKLSASGRKSEKFQSTSKSRTEKKLSAADNKLKKFLEASKLHKTQKEIPKENIFNINLKPAASGSKPAIFLETPKIHKTQKEIPKKNIFNIKPADLDNKPEIFLGKPTTQKVITKPYIPQRANRKKNQKSEQELNTLYDFFMADLEANQKKIEEVLKDDDDDEFIYSSNANNSGKQQQKIAELSAMSQGNAKKTSCQEEKAGTSVLEEKKTIMPNRPVNTCNDQQPMKPYNDSANTNRANTKSNTATNGRQNTLIRMYDEPGWPRHLDKSYVGNETIRSIESEGTFANYLSTAKGVTSTPTTYSIPTKGKHTAKHHATLSPDSQVKTGSLADDTSSSDEYMSYSQPDDLDLNIHPRSKTDNSKFTPKTSEIYHKKTNSKFTPKTTEISHKKANLEFTPKATEISHKISNVDPVPKRSSTALHSDLSADGVTGSDKSLPSNTVRTSNNNTSNKLQPQPLEVSKANKQIVVDETQFYTGSSQSFSNKNTSVMSNVSKGQKKVESDTNSTQSIFKTPTARQPNQDQSKMKDNKQTVTEDNKVVESQPLYEEPKSNKVTRQTRSTTATSLHQQPSKKTSKVTRKPRTKPKKTQDDKASEDQAYKKLETHVMAPIRSKRQREMDKFFDDVKRMRTNIEASTEKPDSEYANIQYCPSKKQMSKLEYVAVGQRKTTGEMKVQINTPKPALKSSPTTDYLIEKYLGKEALLDYHNPSKKH